MLGFIGDTFIVLVYFLPLLVILYFLLKALIFLFSNINVSSSDNVKKSFPFLKIKIAFTILGILYCLFIFLSLIFMFLRPSWFHPPIWLTIVSIVLLVPYVACVAGIIGLGNIGRSGFSPWKDFKSVINEIKNSHL